jgi:outer membrane biosynthesis protein TonB
MLTELLKGQPVVKPLQAEQQIPLVFVEVSEAQATPEPPKDAKYYSNKNSRAANQESEKNLEAPKIEGKNPELVKTEDVPQQKPAPLQPTPPKPEPQPPKEERKPPPPEPKADWALAKTEPELRKESTNKVEKPQKPRTVQEARAQLEQKKLPGQRMKLEGGVSLHSKQDALNAKATPFGDYDWALVEAIQSAWYGRLTEQRYASDYRGKVVVTFQLHYDGRITGLSILENTAGSIPSAICEEAITKPVPYNKFPAEMRRVVGDLRSIQFTFFYD